MSTTSPSVWPPPFIDSKPTERPIWQHGGIGNRPRQAEENQPDALTYWSPSGSIGLGSVTELKKPLKIN